MMIVTGNNNAEVLVRVCMCVCDAGRGYFSSCLHSYPPLLFLSPLFLCAGILRKQIGANRLCHCLTWDSNRKKEDARKGEKGK